MIKAKSNFVVKIKSATYLALCSQPATQNGTFLLCVKTLTPMLLFQTLNVYHLNPERHYSKTKLLCFYHTVFHR